MHFVPGLRDYRWVEVLLDGTWIVQIDCSLKKTEACVDAQISRFDHDR